MAQKPALQSRRTKAFAHSARMAESDQWEELENLLRQAYERVRVFAAPRLSALRAKLSWKLVLGHPKLLAAAAASLVLVFLAGTTTMDSGLNMAGGALQPVVDTVQSRAAFHIVDDFTNGVGEWWAGSGLVAEAPGQVRVAGLALHNGTMNLDSYRMDFDVKIGSRGVGWLVRAADRDTYYAFELSEAGRGKGRHRLIRYPVVDGKPDQSQRAEVDVPEGLVKDDFNRVSMRLRENQIVTLINGRGVDYWSDSQLPKGGVGFWVEKGQSGFIRQMTVSGNEDFWGLTLYAAMETGRAVKIFLASLSSDPAAVAGELQRGIGEQLTVLR
jgi:hypothetical protein